VKVRHQTRNHEKQYLTGALVNVANHRVQSSHPVDKTVMQAKVFSKRSRNSEDNGRIDK
jgi:hypothetical protein